MAKELYFVQISGLVLAASLFNFGRFTLLLMSERGFEWSRHPSSTSQLLGLIPRGNEFLGWVKKNPLSPHAKA
jgi:hypothetical protein